MSKTITTIGHAVKDTLDKIYPNGYTLALVYGSILAEMERNGLEISMSTLRRYMDTPLSELPSMSVGFLCAVQTATSCSLYEYAQKLGFLTFNQMFQSFLVMDK